MTKEEIERGGEKILHACYYDKVDGTHYFWRSPNPRDYPNSNDRIEYIGLVPLSISDFPVKLPVFTIHGQIIEEGVKKRVHPPKDAKGKSNFHVIEHNMGLVTKGKLDTDPNPESQWSLAFKRERAKAEKSRQRRRENFDSQSPYSTKINKRKSIRGKVLERDGHKCLKCGTAEYLTMDHIFPESKGGKFVFENLQTLCLFCNEDKGSNFIDYRQQGEPKQTEGIEWLNKNKEAS